MSESDMTAITGQISDLAADVATAGIAVLGVVIAFAAFKWVRRAVS